MEKRSKYVLIAVALLCTVYGLCSFFNRCGSGADSARDSEYEARARRLADELSTAEKHLEGAAEPTRTSRAAIEGNRAPLERSRSGIDESLAGVGRVGESFATIEECVGASEIGIERLVASVQHIERIIPQAAERENRMDDGNGEPRACCNRLYDCRDSKE